MRHRGDQLRASVRTRSIRFLFPRRGAGHRRQGLRSLPAFLELGPPGPIGPFRELVRPAAQGDVLHNDDTTTKILELMDERVEWPCSRNSPALRWKNPPNQLPNTRPKRSRKTLPKMKLHRGASLADARGAKNSTAERPGLLASGIVSTREGRRIALFFSGHQHVGENLQDVLAQRGRIIPRRSRCVMPLAQSARQAADDSGQPSGSPCAG